MRYLIKRSPEQTLSFTVFGIVRLHVGTLQEEAAKSKSHCAIEGTC